MPPLSDLPVEGCVDALRVALARDGHAVLQAPPGAGKTTIVPLRLLDEPWLAGGRVVVLEPRRLAARAAARRMADLLGEEVGETVGYRTRDERRVGRDTRIEVVTEGILTRRVQQDPSLPGVGLVVFDEIHERNLQADLALALVLDARPVLCPELRILAMSATLDAGPVAARLGGRRGGATTGRPDGGAPAPWDATIVTSEGRRHRVEIRWRPPGPRDRIDEATAAAVQHALRTDAGDVLVFLAGAADIRRVGERLGRGGLPPGVDVRPLFGALTPVEQDLALAASPAGRRRVVLATDIAETSLTVAGVRVVIDAGEVRTPRRDPGSGLTRLRTGPTSRASAEQRAGRAGRTGPGIAYRLWSEAEHGRRAPFALPEIATVDLAGFALELARWGSAPADLLLLDQPPAAAMADARELLHELGALDGDGRITTAGGAMVELPVHPRLARMIGGAADADQVAMACALAALLEERDVLRSAPGEVPADLAERVQLISDPRSTHALADRRALALVRRRATELERRARVHDAPGGPRGAATEPRTHSGGSGGAAAEPRTHSGGSGGAAAEPRTHSGGSGGAAAEPRTQSGGSGGAPTEPRTRAGVGAGEANGPSTRKVGTACPRPSARPRAGVGGGVDLGGCGALVALAYPDRIAQARGGGRFRLRDGLGASLPSGDGLTAEPYLVVAELVAAGWVQPGADELRISLAAAVDLADIEIAAGASIELRSTLVWDAERDDLRARTERRLGALVLSSVEARAEAGEQTTAALVDRVRATRLGALRWTPAARSLQVRAGFARRAGGNRGDVWPDLSDRALLEDLESWLAPQLLRATGRADLERVDVVRALRDRLGHHRVVELDEVIPTTIGLPGGRRVTVDYDGEAPAIAVRVQDLFGITAHPTVGAGRIPLVVHLLSPAGRPVQITADLPGFWAGSWLEVRKELAGRYPKHTWPVDPTTAPPRRPRSPRRPPR